MAIEDERITGRVLNERYGLGAEHALYREDGRWYHQLRAFPGVLFDAAGYVLFRTEEEYRECNHLQIAQDVHAPMGISSIPGYTRYNELREDGRPPRGGLLETAPPAAATRRRPKSKPRARGVTDYAARDANNRALGLAGEELVLAHEKELLTKAGRSDLATAVRHVAKDEGDGAGYDIESVRPDGVVKYIEVKTTSRPAATPFFITANEIAFSKEHRENYYLYRVYEYDQTAHSGKLYVVPGSIKDSFGLEPVQFKATLLQ